MLLLLVILLMILFNNDGIYYNLNIIMKLKFIKKLIL